MCGALLFYLLTPLITDVPSLKVLAKAPLNISEVYFRVHLTFITL